jgi:colicin import membrane protein
MSAQKKENAEPAPVGLRRRAGSAGGGTPGVTEARRPRRRRNPGASLSLFYALLVHLVLIAVLFTGLRWSSRPQPPPIQAYIAAEPKAEPRAAEPPPPPRAEPRAEDERRAAEQKKQEEERARREAEVKRKLEEEKKAAEAKRRAEEEKKRAEAARKQEEAQRRKQAEEEFKQSLAAEQRAREQAAADARVTREVDRYIELVRQRVSRVWSRPGTRKGLRCTVFVRVAPGGEVLEARITRSSGDVAFDRSVENAVYKAVPLPVPAEPAAFEKFREIEFVFNPEE